jgi:hypothetical protein
MTAERRYPNENRHGTWQTKYGTMPALGREQEWSAKAGGPGNVCGKRNEEREKRKCCPSQVEEMFGKNRQF